MKKQLTLLLLFCSLFTISHAQTYKGKQKDINIILKNIAQFSQNYMNGDAAAIANSYTADGKIFPSNQEIISGTKDLKKYWTTPADIKVKYHKITPLEIEVIKKTAYDYGYYEGETILKDGTSSKWKGKYMIVWKKVGKEWKIYLDIWNPIKS